MGYSTLPVNENGNLAVYSSRFCSKFTGKFPGNQAVSVEPAPVQSLNILSLSWRKAFYSTV